jgi:hypothetical protein
MTTTIALHDPDRIQPPHDIVDAAKLDALTEAMTASGWVGAPVVVTTIEPGDPIAVTGSHRIRAAARAGIDVPVVDLADLLAAHGHDLTALVAGYTAAGLDLASAVYEVAARADYLLPTETIEEYGIDLH